MKIQENRTYVVFICMTGFVIGIVYSNLLANQEIADMGIFHEYFLGRFPKLDILTADFIWYVARIRICPILILAALGCTKFRKAAAVVFLVWTGFSCGMILTAAVLKMGGRGLVLCLIALTPHLFFYAAGYLVLLWYLLRYPQVRWNFPKTVSMVLLLLTGLLLECYVNPVLMQMFVRTIK